jgi:hypothetical protein
MRSSLPKRKSAAEWLAGTTMKPASSSEGIAKSTPKNHLTKASPKLSLTPLTACTRRASAMMRSLGVCVVLIGVPAPPPSSAGYSAVGVAPGRAIATGLG